MRVLGRALTIMGLLFAACGSIESKQPTTEHSSGIASDNGIVAADPETTAHGSEYRIASNDFSPTDPTAVVLASGGPQLIEFYADW